MRKLVLILLLLSFACKNDPKEKEVEQPQPTIEHKSFSTVEIEPILTNDSLSIRAIEVIGPNLAFAGNNGTYGLYNSSTDSWKTNVQTFNGAKPEFRAVASTASDFFMLSVGNPALLYKTGNDGKMKLVYKEEDEKVFYDAINFWNNKEGIAMGDPTDTCISIIVTRDGGNSWSKISCEDLPEAAEGEAAFAASNSNIAINGKSVWILTGGVKSRILHSGDKGKTWEVFETPIIQGKSTTGGYSLDFYNENKGIIIGGDYTNPESNTSNKAITEDGGRTWKLIADGKDPGYKSGIRFVPNSKGKEIIAVGFTGLDYSKDGGNSWKKLSEEGFYTLRFVSDSIAYAAGKGRIVKLKFQ